MALTLVTGPATEPLTVAEVRSQLRLGVTAGEPCPIVANVALPTTPAPGNCDNGSWRVGFTFVTADGETELGPLSATATVADKTVNGQLAITSIMTGGSAVTARKCYAIPPSGSTPQLAATIADNTSTTLTLNIAASSLGAGAPTVNTTSDPLLVSLIQSARERAELATGRALITQTWDLVLDRFPDHFIEIPKAPLQSITSVIYTNTGGATVTWPSTNYLVQAPVGPRARRGRLALPFASVWPIPLMQMGAVTVRFVCGYGATAAAVPAMLKAAMKMDIATLYANREDLITGTIVASVPQSARAIYWAHRSFSTQEQGR